MREYKSFALSDHYAFVASKISIFCLHLAGASMLAIRNRKDTANKSAGSKIPVHLFWKTKSQ